MSKKGLKMGLGICGLAMCGLVGASVVKGAWDNLHQEKSVSVSIGTATNLSNVSITGGDLTKKLVPSGATLGTNEVTELNLGTLTYTKSSNISDVRISFDVFCNGEKIDDLLFDVNLKYGDSGDSFSDYDDFHILPNENEIELYLVLNKNSSNITDSEINTISGKTLNVVFNFEGVKA